MNNKVSVLMPTYNDSLTICKAFDSLKNQTYTNWELIIINDGSTDDTEKIVKKYIKNNKLENKFKYLYEDNMDQLNAIKNGLNYITGDFVYILHSDDLLPFDDFFKECISILERNKSYDAIIGDYVIIDKDDNQIDYWKTPKYRKKIKSVEQVLLKYGGNIYGDVAFHRRSSYENYVKNNYLDWNTPFWIDFSKEGIHLLNVLNAPFPILKYRLDGTNYNTNIIGKHNVLTGELRTMTNIMKYYNVPLFKLQQFNYNLFRKRYIRKLRLSQYVPLFYFNKEQKNKAKILNLAIRKVYKDGYSTNPWLSSLVKFYSIKSNRVIYIDKVSSEDVLLGSDLRKFTKLLFNSDLPKIYYLLFNEMNSGFKYISVKDEKSKLYIEKIVKFLSISTEVEIVIEKK